MGSRAPRSKQTFGPIPWTHRCPGPLHSRDATVPLPDRRRVHRSAVRRQSARGLPRRQGHSRAPAAGCRTRVQPFGDDVRLPAVRSGAYPARADLHPGTELPFAGHPTVGTAHVLAAIGEIPLTGERTRIVLEELVGPVPVTIHGGNGQPTYCALAVAKLPEEGPPAPPREALARALSLENGRSPRRRLGAARLELRRSLPLRPRARPRCGRPFRINSEAWERALDGTWAPEIFVFARDGERAGSDLHGRMYAPGVRHRRRSGDGERRGSDGRLPGATRRAA